MRSLAAGRNSIASEDNRHYIGFMKSAIIVVLLICVGALAGFGWHQSRQMIGLRVQLAETQTQLQAKPDTEERVAQAERKTKILQDVLTDTSKFAAEKTKQAEQLQQSLAEAKTNNANPFADMFKDPKMRDMIKSQQKAVLGPMIAKQYAAFYQQMNMTPEQTAAFKDLLVQKMSAGTEAGMSMLDSSLDATQRADLAKQVKAQTDEFDAQIKAFLGDENYKTFQDYEKTVPDRMVVGQFSDSLADGATALSQQQQTQLIQAMSDGRNNFKWTTDYNNANPANTDYSTMFTDQKIEQFAQEKQQLDQQVLAKAQQILTPEQFAAFKEFHTSQSAMQLVGMKMAAKMFAPKSQ